MMGGKTRNILSGTSSLNAMASVMAVIIGLAAGLLVLLLSNPSRALAGFGAILTSGFSDMRQLGQVLYFATPIIMTGLSVGFVNRTGLFNIGASGQFTAGAYAAILVGVRGAGFLPVWLHCAAALVAGMLAGALWGCVPGILKAYRNINEVIACIMMNYIGMFLTNFLITRTVYDSLRNQSMRVPRTANLPKAGFDAIFAGSSANSGIIIAIVTAVIAFIILEKTRFGYELKACGLNRDAAKYAGINERRSIIWAMTLGGAMAGLGGALLYLAGSGKSLTVVDVLAPEGFNGIPVALLGLNHPIGIIFSGFLVAYLSEGGFNMQLYGFAPQVIEIIIAVIIYFSAFALLIRSFIQSRMSAGTAPDGVEKGND